jgi:hypothetical protein
VDGETNGQDQEKGPDEFYGVFFHEAEEQRILTIVADQKPFLDDGKREWFRPGGDGKRG